MLYLIFTAARTYNLAAEEAQFNNEANLYPGYTKRRQGSSSSLMFICSTDELNLTKLTNNCGRELAPQQIANNTDLPPYSYRSK